MAGVTSNEICVFGSQCVESSNSEGRWLRSKGIQTLIEVSQKRRDGLHHTILQSESIYIHNRCYKMYTSSKNIEQALKPKADQSTLATPVSLRSEQMIFDYKTHCLICSKQLDFDAERRHPNRHSKISSIEIIERNGSCRLQDTLLTACESRVDPTAIAVKSRILCVGDIRAAEAKYHRTCMQRFLSQKCSDNISTSNRHDEQNAKAFKELCDWLEAPNQTDGQYTINDLQSKMKEFLPDGCEGFHKKYFKRLFLETFSDRITVTKVEGRPSIFTLATRASAILQESYSESQSTEEQESTMSAKYVGGIIRQELLNLEQTGESYPVPSDTNLEALEAMITPTLQTLVGAMFTNTHVEKAPLKKRLLKASVSHILMNAAGRQSYISPLLLSVGLFIHQTTRSRVLIDVLSSLGMCVPYATVMAFQRSAVAGHPANDLPIGMNCYQEDRDENFCQWVADNFDYNEDTVSGYNTTHVMGLITCQSPSRVQPDIIVPRSNPSAAELLKGGNYGGLIKAYRSPPKNKLHEVVFRPVEFQIDTECYFNILDTLWLFSSLLHPSPPNWQGFMATVTAGTWQTSSIVYNPVIPLNPNTDDAVYSTMVFVQEQSIKAGMCCATLTFDQPLYIRAYKIKKDNSQDFKKMFLRLGGFHQLMSFLGAGCKLMEGSGLEDLWAVSYANRSIPKMMEGKAYARALRACLLTDAALHITLLRSQEEAPSISPRVDDKLDDNMSESSEDSDSDNDESTEISFTGRLSDQEKDGDLHEALPEGLRDVYISLNDNKITTHDAAEHQALKQLHEKMKKLKVKVSQNSRTAKLWLMFSRFVAIIRLFIRSERTGNWDLHLYATKEMLPYLAAAGHNNYSRCCRLYLQDCQDLCPCLKSAFNKGLFTVHRNKTLFWSGTWTDMTIEQCLMRAGKTQGGLINLTHKESAKMKWLMGSHIVARYTDALRALTGITAGSFTEQHREMRLASRRRDTEDMRKFVSFLEAHNMFKYKPSEKCSFINIATGVVADSRVNVDDALTIGWKIHAKMTGMCYGKVSFKKSDQAVTFKVMRKPVQILNDNIFMSSSEMYQRLLSMVCVRGPLESSLFKYELAPVAPALFHDDGSMRRTDKSLLANHIITMSPNIVANNVNYQPQFLVYDGAYMLHRLNWPKVGTVETLCQLFTNCLLHNWTPGIRLCVVFDSYETITSKAPEQKRRKTAYTPYPVVDLHHSTNLPTDKDSFLANMQNKQALVRLLGSSLEDSGICVAHAEEEGDADTTIVRKVLQFAVEGLPVVVVANDTDILVMLLHHVKKDMDVYMKRSNVQMVSIQAAKMTIGETMCRCILFAHAVSGCDTTSAVFGMGKLRAFKLLQKSEQWQQKVTIFGQTDANVTDITKTGVDFLSFLYCSGQQNMSLTDIRYQQFISPKYVPLERMAPTERAAEFHALRVHHQVSTWLNLHTVLPLVEYGFIVSDNIVSPVITDNAPGPDELLREIRCSCKSSTPLCKSCTCCKYNIPCSIHCHCNGQCENNAHTDSV